jgi:hypothetical protein
MKSWPQNVWFEQCLLRIKISGHWQEGPQKWQLPKMSQAKTDALPSIETLQFFTEIFLP